GARPGGRAPAAGVRRGGRRRRPPRLRARLFRRRRRRGAGGVCDRGGQRVRGDARGRPPGARPALRRIRLEGGGLGVGRARGFAPRAGGDTGGPVPTARRDGRPPLRDRGHGGRHGRGADGRLGDGAPAAPGRSLLARFTQNRGRSLFEGWLLLRSWTCRRSASSWTSTAAPCIGSAWPPSGPRPRTTASRTR